jgi:hypothetical protein
MCFSKTNKKKITTVIVTIGRQLPSTARTLSNKIYHSTLPCLFIIPMHSHLSQCPPSPLTTFTAFLPSFTTQLPVQNFPFPFLLIQWNGHQNFHDLIHGGPNILFSPLYNPTKLTTLIARYNPLIKLNMLKDLKPYLATFAYFDISI